MEKPTDDIVSDTIFVSETYIDKAFDYIYKEYPKANKHAVPPIFTLITAVEYFKSFNLTPKKFRENLEKASNVSAILRLKNLSMGDLLNYTNIELSNIAHITTDQIIKKEKSWQQIILNNNAPSCIIILKNTIFFIVISDPVSNKYHVRDCQQKYQYSFINKELLIEHLNKHYLLSSEMIVDGFKIPEYSNIEYVSISKSFVDTIDYKLEESLFSPKKPEDGPIIIKPIDSKEKKSIIVGYVENPPPDNVDIFELQKKFGEGIYVDKKDVDKNTGAEIDYNEFNTDDDDDDDRDYSDGENYFD